MIQDDGVGGRNTGAKTAGSGGKRSDPDSAYVPEPDAEKKDLDENQGYTRATRGKARSVSSPMKREGIGKGHSDESDH